jgi:hypothetical protein
MTIEAVVSFLGATSSDQDLQKDLAGIIGTGDGDISSAEELDGDEVQALLGQRGILVATFAGQRGYDFSVAELNTVIGVYQRMQAGELTEAEVGNALGIQGSDVQMSAVGKSLGFVYRGVTYSTEEAKSSATQVLDFMKKTAEDEALRDELAGILAVGDGDISDFSELDEAERAALQSERGALVAEFAARHGFQFTLADLMAVTDAFHRVKQGELTGEEFDKFLRLTAQSKDFFPFIDKVVDMTYKGFAYSTAVASRAKDNTLPVIRFFERSDSDPELQAQLQSILGGDGNISDPSELDAEEAKALSSERSNQIVAIGAEHGFRFTVSDLSAVVGAFQLVNSGELPMESAQRILGLGKAPAVLGGTEKTAGMVYRGVSY